MLHTKIWWRAGDNERAAYYTVLLE